MPYLAKIFIYPIKSLDGMSIDRAKILPGGGLVGDREFAIVDQDGRFVNGKRTAKVHWLRSSFDLEARTVTIGIQGQDEQQTFHLDGDRDKLATWLSDYFGYPVTLQQNLHQGFPDDLEASGPTIVATTTLETVASWYPDLSLEDIRRRFRTNLEIGAVPPFWEDCLFGEVGQLVPFQMGEVNVWGSNPCQRCVVITRNHLTGAADAGFQKQFVAQRQATLPTWANPSRFNHFYRLTLNTQVPKSEAGKQLQVGDLLEKLS